MFHVSSAQCGLCTQPIDKRHFKPPVDSASIKSIDSSIQTSARRVSWPPDTFFGHTCELLCILVKLKGDLRCRRCMNPQYNFGRKDILRQVDDSTRGSRLRRGGAVTESSNSQLQKEYALELNTRLIHLQTLSYYRIWYKGHGEVVSYVPL
jgi:hypothetical protein